MNRWPDINGWMHDSDRTWLYDLVRSLHAARVVEVGCYEGRTSVVLAMAVQQTGGRLDCVDPWDEPVNGDWVAHQWLRHMSQHRVDDVARVHCEKSAEYAQRYDGTADLVFIDGGHQYATVRADIEAWYPRSRMVCGHDWHLADVRKAVEEYADHAAVAVHLPGGTSNVWSFPRRVAY